jgi:hypothetical protein
MKQCFVTTVLLCAIAASAQGADPSAPQSAAPKWDTEASRRAKIADDRALVDQAVRPATARDAKEIQVALKVYGFPTTLTYAYGRFPTTPDGVILSVVVSAEGNVSVCELKSPSEGVSEGFVTRMCDKLQTIYFGRKNSPENVRFPLGLSRPPAHPAPG